MRHLKLLLFLSIISIVNCYAQNPRDFPDSNYHFNEHRWKSLFELAAPDEFDYTIYHKKDTLINAKKYALLNLKYSILFKDGPGQPDGTYAHGDIPIAYLDNDKTNKRVYIKRLGFNKGFFSIPFDSTFQLLYDFNLKQGDIYPVTTSNLTLDTNLRVIKVDTLTDPNNVRRAYYVIGSNTFPSFLNGFVIEGLCGRNGILGSIFARWDNTYQEQFYCYSIGNKSYFPTFLDTTAYIFENLGQTCNKHVYLSTSAQKKSEISIYPNPIQDKLYINTNGTNIQDVEIYNTLGNIVYKNIPNSNDPLNLQFLENGIYYLRIKLVNNEIIHKIISK
jgi:Secretion system C-terminal sorting domain